jgi:flagellar basal body-associated protein FliL
MNSKLRKIILVVLLVMAAGGAVGYFLWNKPHKDVFSANSIQSTAATLYQSFIKDSAAANVKYIDKVVEVSGIVKTISVNQQQQKVVSLQTGSGDAAINCTMEQKDAVIKEGTAIKIKGICSGLGEGDADLGIMGDVYLIRCYIAE